MRNQHITGTIQAVVFDLDGVLMDSEWLSYRVWNEYVQQFGGSLDEARYVEIIGKSQEDTALQVMKQAHVTFDVAESVTYAWQEVTNRLKTEVEPLPGAVGLVKQLAEMGYPLAIATNSIHSYVDNALEGLGLSQYFPIRVCIDQIANGKPAPDVYLGAAQRLGIEPQRCLAVEDSRVGLQAAVAAGMRAIAVPTPLEDRSYFSAAWKIYDSLVQVSESLNQILA